MLISRPKDSCNFVLILVLVKFVLPLGCNARVLRKSRQVTTGSGLASFPGLTGPTIVQPSAGQPCPIILAPKRFAGGAKFGNPYGIGLNVRGQDQQSGPWGGGFDTAFGEEVGGSVFGDTGMAPLDYDCEYPEKSSPPDPPAFSKLPPPKATSPLVYTPESVPVPESAIPQSSGPQQYGSPNLPVSPPTRQTASLLTDPIANAKLSADVLSHFQNWNRPRPINLQSAFLAGQPSSSSIFSSSYRIL